MTLDDVMELAGDYFDCGVLEGRERREVDTPDGAAQKALLALRAAIEQYAAEQRGSGEPVAWLYKIKMRNRGRMEYASVSDSERRDDDITDAEWATRIVEPLYAAPPKREPYTEAQIDAALDI